ncbi:hypothetical protein KKC88_06220 [Patescibacteria group bacterium]|nr:hypothetical protein [Patescibacteria group bacterium]MBU1673922.1 hypothetical protein [Patescibacteria group bacterium]MBU1963916.1 hypothetical protein [Patescibacteria group bacterium]
MVAPAENLRHPKITREALEAFEADDPALQEILRKDKSKQKIELRKMIQQYADMAKNAGTEEKRETYERWMAGAKKNLEDLEK